MRLRLVVRGMLGYLPGFLDSVKNRKEKTGTISARYCYSVWLRHLVYLNESGMKSIPKKIAEIGPGASLGIGLSAVLSGVGTYFAFDIIRHSDSEKNLEVLEELILLFKNNTDIPDDSEFPNLYPKLDSYKFPKYILTENMLKNSLGAERLSKIREQIANPGKSINSDIQINYKVPWFEDSVIQPETIDLIISQAVLEHIIDLEGAFRSMNKWLKTGGYVSHEIDYKAHETHKVWNGHWFYSKILWKIILKGRSYPINRQPHSYYIKLINDCGFSLVQEIKNTENNGYHEYSHKKKLSTYEDGDFIIKSALLQGFKS